MINRFPILIIQLENLIVFPIDFESNWIPFLPQKQYENGKYNLISVISTEIPSRLFSAMRTKGTKYKLY